MAPSTTVHVHGRPHLRQKPERVCRVSPNEVTALLEEMGVLVEERDIHGWRIGDLRLLGAGGVRGMGGWFVRSRFGPEVRSRIAYTKGELRELCRDYFPRARRQREPRFPTTGPFNYKDTRWIRPRLIDERGEMIVSQKRGSTP